MSIKIFFLIKYYMFLFFFSSILMEESYWTICGMWSIGKINLDRREAQMFSMFNYFFKKTFLVTTLCCRETALWATYWMSSCAVWGLWESVGAAKPGEERDDLLRTCSWSRHAVLPGCQQKGLLIIPARTKSTCDKRGCVGPCTGATISTNCSFLLWNNLVVGNNS